MPYDGASDEGDWTGYIPFEELPHLYNPPEGFIVTANQRIVGTGYKYQQISRDAAAPWRARRIYDLLSANPKMTMNDVRDVQYDVFNIPLSNLAREIVKVSVVPEFKQLLSGWDGRMTADSKAALVANEIRNCAANKIAEDNPPVPSYIIRERILDWAVKEKTPRWLPKGFAGYPDLINTCEKESLAKLGKKIRRGQGKMDLGQCVSVAFSTSFSDCAFNRRAVCHQTGRHRRQRANAECRLICFDASHRQPGQLGRDAPRHSIRTKRESAKPALERPV